MFTQELRLSGAKNRFQWVLGGFYSHTRRDYGQTLITAGFQDATGIPTAGTRRAQGQPCSSPTSATSSTSSPSSAKARWP